MGVEEDVLSGAGEGGEAVMAAAGGSQRRGAHLFLRPAAVVVGVFKA